MTFFALMRLTVNGGSRQRPTYCDLGAQWSELRPPGENPCANSAVFSLPPFLSCLLSAPSPKDPRPRRCYRIGSHNRSIAPTPCLGGKCASPWRKANLTRGLSDNPKVLQGMTINFKRSEAQEASLAGFAAGAAGSVFSQLSQVAHAGAVWATVWHERGRPGQGLGVAAARRIHRHLALRRATIPLALAETSRPWKELFRRKFTTTV